LGLATGTAGYTAVLAVGIVMLVADDRREEEGDFSALAYIALGPAVALLAGLTSVVWVSAAACASPITAGPNCGTERPSCIHTCVLCAGVELCISSQPFWAEHTLQCAAQQYLPA